MWLGPFHEEIAAMGCAKEEHYPFVLKKTEDGDHFYGIIRTSSWDLDGCGGRTDIHDLLPVLWGLVLRANGAASTTLVDFEGWTGFPTMSEWPEVTEYFHQREQGQQC